MRKIFSYSCLLRSLTAKHCTRLRAGSRAGLHTRSAVLATIALGSILLFGSSVQPAFADVRIATVDVARLLNESSEARSQKATLDKLSKSARDEINEKREALKKLQERAESKEGGQDSPAMKDLREQAREYSRMVKDKEEELREKFLRVNQELTKKAIDSVKKFAEKNRIDLVLDKSSRERSPVLYGMPQVDITKDIIEMLEE